MYRPRPGSGGDYDPHFTDGRVIKMFLLISWSLSHGLRHWGGLPNDFIILPAKSGAPPDGC